MTVSGLAWNVPKTEASRIDPLSYLEFLRRCRNRHSMVYRRQARRETGLPGVSDHPEFRFIAPACRTFRHDQQHTNRRTGDAARTGVPKACRKRGECPSWKAPPMV